MFQTLWWLPNPLRTLSRVLTTSYKTWFSDNLPVHCLTCFPSLTGLQPCWPPCSSTGMSQCGDSRVGGSTWDALPWALHKAYLGILLLIEPSRTTFSKKPPIKAPHSLPCFSSVTHLYLTLCFLLLLPVSLVTMKAPGGRVWSSLIWLLLFIRYSQCLNNLADSRHWMEKVTGSSHLIWS